MRANWHSIWRRLTPFWLSLWLISSLVQPSVAWQHDNGSYCAPCSAFEFVQPVEVDDCCADDLAPPVVVSHGYVDASCRQCCEPAEEHHSDHFVGRGLAPAVIVAPFQISLPVRREVEVSFATSSFKLVSLPRPPPRGRAPPFEFSFA